MQYTISPIMIRALRELEDYHDLMEDRESYETMMRLPLREVKALADAQDVEQEGRDKGRIPG